MSGHTKKELVLIRSPKHPGAVFIKVKDSHNDFICKFYPWPNGKEATANVEHFMKVWNHEVNGAETYELKMSEFELPLKPDGAGAIVDAAGNFVLAIAGRRLLLENENRALAFVALACNCHDDLVKACEAIVRDYEEEDSEMVIDPASCVHIPNHTDLCPYGLAKAAIAKARQGS